VAVIATGNPDGPHREQLDALVAACVLIAQVDGAVTPDERGRMVERLKLHVGLEGADLETALQAFERLDARFDARPEETWVEAELLIRRLRGRAEAEGVAAAAVAVSIDGGLEAEERSAVLDVCAWLDVSPVRVLP
jgi:tellurite resistance protein TerB